MHAPVYKSGQLAVTPAGFFARRGIVRAIVAGLLMTHAGLLAYSAYKHSPTWDEYGHIVAGISHWEFYRFDLYRVNPPLVRTIATIPVLFSDYETDWMLYYVPDGHRPEHWLQEEFLRLNGASVFWLTTLARWGCIPISLLGGWICYLWGRDLYGGPAGIVAAAMWCFCPNVLGHGSLITPDVGSAAFGVAANYVFWRYLSSPNVERAIASGAMLGLAALTKTTWIVLPPIWLAFWLAWRWKRSGGKRANSGPAVGNGLRAVPSDGVCGASSSVSGDVPCIASGTARRPFPTGALQSPRQKTPDPVRPRWRELLILVVLAWYVFNLGYLFEGTFTRLGDYRFISRTFGGELPIEVRDGHAMRPRNPYADTWLAHVPLPFPKNFVCGIDIQKWDFELNMWSYLRGEWKEGGWWYYYLYAMAIKVPLGAWGLGALAMGMRIAECGMRNYRRVRNAECGMRSEEKRVTERSSTTNLEFRTPHLFDELFLLAPAIAVLALVSSQTGFNHHLRYVLPAFPFLFIWISQAVKRSGKSRVESQEPEKIPSGSRPLSLASRLFYHSAFRIPHSALVLCLLAWFIASSLYYFPHSMSYFNELVGGPTEGWRHLSDSNIDWGQDLLYLKEWYEAHPEARPVSVAYELPFVEMDLVGIDAEKPPPGPESSRRAPDKYGPLPGWHVLSLNEVYDRSRKYEYFRHLQPIDRIGYSMNVYHISLEEANRVRRRTGLPELAP